MKHLYVFDFDGTIAQTQHHRPHTPKNLADAMMVMLPGHVAADTPREKVVEWMRQIHLYSGSQTEVFILTGRPESSRQITEAWLQVHGVPHDYLFMVGMPDCQPTAERKREHLREWQAMFSTITVVDDDAAVGKVCAELGLAFVDATEIK